MAVGAAYYPLGGADYLHVNVHFLKADCSALNPVGVFETEVGAATAPQDVAVVVRVRSAEAVSAAVVVSLVAAVDVAAAVHLTLKRTVVVKAVVAAGTGARSGAGNVVGRVPEYEALAQVGNGAAPAPGVVRVEVRL